MAFNRVLHRGLPALIQKSGQVTSTKKVIPAILSCAERHPNITISRGSAQDIGEEINKERKSQVSFFSLAWEKINNILAPTVKVPCEQEILEKQQFLDKVGGLYYKKPPETPGVEHYKEGFDLLIKWDDWRGVDKLWTQAECEKMVFDDEFIDKIEDYMLDARRRAWQE